MQAPSEPGGIRHLQELCSLEDRHASLSFEEVRQAVLEDEPDGWRNFVEKYSRYVYTVALRLLSGPANQKQERAHEIYCRVFSLIQRNDYRVLRQFQSRCQFTTYLFRTVQTARSGVLREEGRDLDRTDYMDSSEEANRRVEAAMAKRVDSEEPLPCLSPEKLREEITRVLDGLSPREKLLVKLRFQKGLKLREIADAVGYRDTNDVAYALKKAMNRFEPLRALDTGEWAEEELRLVLDVLNQELFQ